MIKSIAGVRRRRGVSRDELFERWEHSHAPFVAEHADPVRYRVTFFDPAADGTLPPYDGLAELWFRDRAHMDRWFHGSVRGSDGFGTLTESAGGFRLLTTEHALVDGAVDREHEKLVFLVRRRPDLSPPELFTHWLNVHGPNVAAAVERTDGSLRYAISVSDLDELGGFDGIAELWWRDGAARELGLVGVADDGFGAMLDRGATLTLIGHEFAVVD